MIAAMVLLFMLLFSVIGAGIRLAWGATKFIFGLGLFWFCPMLFVIIVLLVIAILAMRPNGLFGRAAVRKV